MLNTMNVDKEATQLQGEEGRTKSSFSFYPVVLKLLFFKSVVQGNITLPVGKAFIVHP